MKTVWFEGWINQEGEISIKICSYLEQEVFHKMIKALTKTWKKSHLDMNKIIESEKQFSKHPRNERWIYMKKPLVQCPKTESVKLKSINQKGGYNE
ncbi:MAG: hypothetical protein PHG13_02610 [Candidatus Pacebacteria bacterium]|nr:hypothetical protein [Candidatus Paceibacterota bacterium]MDD5721710.1 hypothetical protein [Candidatus Paceibacterota bacterium]